jgi:hypothetical protein
MVRNHWFLTIFHIIHSPFFQLYCYFWTIVWFGISQSTDGFLPRSCSRPLALNKTERRRKKNGEKPLIFDNFPVHSLTIFSIKLLFLDYRVIWDISVHRRNFSSPLPPPARVKQDRVATKKEWWETIDFWQFSSSFTHLFPINLQFSGLSRDPWYLGSQTDFCPAAAAVRSRLLQQSGDAKRTVRIHCVTTIFQLFHSPFFQLNCYYQGYHMITITNFRFNTKLTMIKSIM